MNQLTKIVPFLMLPILAIGCASSADDAQADEGAFTASTSSGFEASAAVGAVIVNGQKICTAALVDVDAGASVKVNGAEVSLHGRQALLGKACLGRLSPSTVGVAAFVTHVGQLSVTTPILSFDFRDKESIAVAILASAPQGSEPAELATDADVTGFFASANAGAHFATAIEANEDGIQIGAAAEIHGGVAFALKTRCTSFAFQAQAGIAVGAKVKLSDDGLGAAAFIKINGKLKLRAHIDGQCIVTHVSEKLERIATATISAANDVGDGFVKAGLAAGGGKIIGYYDQKNQNADVGVRLTADAKVLRLDGQGHITVKTSVRGAATSCDALLGACELSPADGQGFKAGDVVMLSVDTHNNFFPDRPTGTRIFVATADRATPPASSGDQGGGGGGN